MKREMFVGLIVFIIALASIPIGYYESMVSPPLFKLKDLSKFKFPSYSEELINRTKRPITSDVTELGLNISSTDVFLEIKDVGEPGLLYIIEVYRTKGFGVAREGAGDFRSKEFIKGSYLNLNIFASNHKVKVYVSPNYIDSISIRSTNVFLDLDLSNLNNTDVMIDSSNGFLDLTLDYAKIDSGKISIVGVDGFLDIAVKTPKNTRVDLSLSARNGYLNVDLFGDIITGSKITKKMVSPDLFIVVNIENGFGSLSFMYR